MLPYRAYIELVSRVRVVVVVVVSAAQPARKTATRPRNVNAMRFIFIAEETNMRANMDGFFAQNQTATGSLVPRCEDVEISGRSLDCSRIIKDDDAEFLRGSRGYRRFDNRVRDQYDDLFSNADRPNEETGSHGGRVTQIRPIGDRPGPGTNRSGCPHVRTALD